MKGETPTVELTFPLFETPEGLPTCCFHIGNKDTHCVFLRDHFFSQVYRCAYLGEVVEFYDHDPMNFIQPHVDCPLWREWLDIQSYVEAILK